MNTNKMNQKQAEFFVKGLNDSIYEYPNKASTFTNPEQKQFYIAGYKSGTKVKTIHKKLISKI